jgi:hypothetical protein
MLQPKQGDWYMFCSYGSVPCPPIQIERSRAPNCRFVLHALGRGKAVSDRMLTQRSGQSGHGQPLLSIIKHS